MIHCTDELGCQQCDEGSTREFDNICGVWYCNQHLGTDYSDLRDESIRQCPRECLFDPCSCAEINNCNICHYGNGCDQCERRFFKKDYNYHCAQCQATFGNGCLHCTDFKGCKHFATGFNRVYDNDCGLYKCDPI